MAKQESPPLPARSAGVSVIAVAALVWVLWLTGMVGGDRWGLFEDNWFMSVTMVFGSFIAGATITGHSAESISVESRSSASPQAALARRSADAGATTSRSALVASSM